MYSGNSQHRCPPKPPINYRLKEKEVLDQILGNYDARIRPSGVNGTGKNMNNIA